MNFFLDNENNEKSNNIQSIRESINNLEENTMIRITADSKRKAAINRMTLAVAKENQDPLYFKYQSSKRRMMDFRAKIRQRYYSEALRRIFKKNP